MKMPLISIVIPTYNAAEYIGNTLDSIQRQSFSDFELVLVNDGSTDETLKILQSYQRADERIKILTIKNSGPAEARNKGIKAAIGKYIMFVDSDDELTENALGAVADLIKNNDLDLLIFGFNICNKSDDTVYHHFFEDLDIKSKEELKANIGELYINNQLNQVWNKAYKTEMLKNNDIRFPDQRFGEDRLFVFEVLKYASRIFVSKKALYNYIMQNDNSLINRYMPKKHEYCNMIQKSILDLQDSLGAFDSETLNQMQYMYVKCILSCITPIYHPSCPLTGKEKRKAISGIVKNRETQNYLAGYKPAGLMMKMLTIGLKTKSVSINALMAKTIYITSKHSPRAFFGMKHPKAEKKQIG